MKIEKIKIKLVDLYAHNIIDKKTDIHAASCEFSEMLGIDVSVAWGHISKRVYDIIEFNKKTVLRKMCEDLRDEEDSFEDARYEREYSAGASY